MCQRKMFLFYFTAIFQLIFISADELCHSVDYSSCGGKDPTVCVSNEWWCDGHVDCDNGFDEFNCSSIKCSNSDFQCASGLQCVPHVLECDGITHCVDGSDEIGCNNKADKPKGCDPIKEFDCNNDGHECIALSKVCNKYYDCTKQTDEKPGGNIGNCQVDNCKYKNKGGCSHICINRYTETVCDCPEGYQLKNDKKTCVNINECIQWPPKCAQSCQDKDGGYQCSCQDGYLVDTQNPNECLSIGERKILFSAMGGHLGIFELNKKSGNVPSEYKTFEEDIVNYVTDVRNSDQKLYVLQTNVNNKNCTLLEFDLESNEINRILYSVNNTVCYGLTYDWLRNLIFWTSRDEGRIYVTNATSGSTAVLDSDVDAPHQITFDPYTLTLYWIKLSSITLPPFQLSSASSTNQFNAKILALQLNERKQKEVVSKNLRHPISLSLDFVHNRIYWSDLNPGAISYIDLSKPLIIHTIVEHQLLYPFSIVVVENRVYWSDWRQNNLMSIDKHIGYPHVKVETTLLKPYTLQALTLSSQPLTSNVSQVTCLPGGHQCADICISHADSQQYTCLCSINTVLLSDRKSCIESNLAMRYPHNYNRRTIVISVSTALVIVLAISLVLVMFVALRHKLPLCNSSPKRTCNSFSKRNWFQNSIVTGDMLIMFKCSSQASQLSDLLSNDHTNLQNV